MESYIKELELGRTRFFVRHPKLSIFFKLAGGALIFYAAKMEFRAISERGKAALKKARFEEPEYEVTAANLDSLPWKGDYANWQHRRVTLEGRAVHRLAYHAPAVLDQYPGFYYIVPVVLDEDKEWREKRGLLVNMGWYPHEFRHEWRMPLPPGYSKLRVHGVLNRGEDLVKKGYFKPGNAFDEQRRIHRNFNMKEYAQYSEFVNKDDVRLGMVEVIDMDQGKNYGSPNVIDRDLSGIKKPPFARTPEGYVRTETDTIERRWKQAFLLGAGMMGVLYG